MMLVQNLSLVDRAASAAIATSGCDESMRSSVKR